MPITIMHQQHAQEEKDHFVPAALPRWALPPSTAICRT